MTEQTRHLLIVEDEAPLRQAIAEQLADHGYLVEQAESGEAAVARLADFAFDIIITDLRLPGIDGSSVVEAAVERYPDIVAIVITGYGTFKDAVIFWAVSAGTHSTTTANAPASWVARASSRILASSRCTRKPPKRRTDCGVMPT